MVAIVVDKRDLSIDIQHKDYERIGCYRCYYNFLTYQISGNSQY